MFQRKLLLTFSLSLLISGPACLAPAADHLDAPALQQPGQGGRDINDVYAFQSPNNPANTVLILTVNPFAGMVNPFGTMSPRTFDTTVEYQFQIDNNGDAVADVTYATIFTPAVGGVQTFTTARNGSNVATGNTGTDLAVLGGGMVHAGLFEDPFFFDLVAFNDNLNFSPPGDDTFALADVSAIVLELPSTQLQDGANTNIGVWARTLVGGNQIDRMGRPAINTALIPDGMKDAFNQASPQDNPANPFTDEVRDSIFGLNGGNATHADNTTDLLLPDILTFDTSSASGFLNGRRLPDDVIDAVLATVSNGAVTTDFVDSNDAVFPGVFPYLADPNLIPEPTTIALLAMGLSAIGSTLRGRRRRA